MSRIGKLPITVPKGVEVTLAESSVTLKGPKGTATVPFGAYVSVKREGEEIQIIRASEADKDRAFQGLFQRLISNSITGVSAGFTRELQLVGVGYRAEVKGTTLVLRIGYSHEVPVAAPEGIVFTTPEPTRVVVSGHDKQRVGQVAANIRSLRPPEPYKGKGIRYKDEQVRRKEGKSAAKK